MALVPKGLGNPLNVRPIIVAPFPWRLVAKAALQNIAPWFQSWARSSLIGGVPGRHLAMAVASLLHHVSTSRLLRLPLAGARLDLSRCFDR